MTDITQADDIDRALDIGLMYATRDLELASSGREATIKRAQTQLLDLHSRAEKAEALLATYKEVTGFDCDAACPICDGIEGCDHSWPERFRAALSKDPDQ